LVNANLTAGDSDIVKVDKIMRLIDSSVTYEHRSSTEILFPTEVLTFGSGDCTGFSCLVACLFEEVGIKSAIGFFTNSTYPEGHAMVLVHLDDLGFYAYSYYSDLTGKGLSSGKWIIIEPKDGSLSAYSHNLNWVNLWSLSTADEVPYGA
jgi:hypothetical protein